MLTNCAPTGPYRGAGRPEAIYFIERLMDAAARKTGIDAAELRRRNMIRPGQMPYRNPMSKTYDSGQFGHQFGAVAPQTSGNFLLITVQAAQQALELRPVGVEANAE